MTGSALIERPSLLLGVYVCSECSWEYGMLHAAEPVAGSVAYPCCWKGPGHKAPVSDVVAIFRAPGREMANLAAIVLPSLAAGESVLVPLRANLAEVPLDSIALGRPERALGVEFAAWPNRGGIP